MEDKHVYLYYHDTLVESNCHLVRVPPQCDTPRLFEKVAQYVLDAVHTFSVPSLLPLRTCDVFPNSTLLLRRVDIFLENKFDVPVLHIPSEQNVMAKMPSHVTSSTW
jgi:hypothetical protein